MKERAENERLREAFSAELKRLHGQKDRFFVAAKNLHREHSVEGEGLAEFMSRAGKALGRKGRSDPPKREGAQEPAPKVVRGSWHDRYYGN